MKAPASFFGVTALATAFSAVAAPTLSEADFEAILKAGKWNATAEDSEAFYKEQIPAQTVRGWITQFDPSRAESMAAIGVLTLATAVAEWGITSDLPLPTDPDGQKKWSGSTTGDDGKHLMSYAVGGIGVDHTDSGALVDLFDYIKVNHPNLGPKPDRFFKLRGINFDRIRANGGVCANPRNDIGVDLDGKPFGHDKFGGGKKYCQLYAKGNTTPEDWQIFRHWTRAALRQKDVQRHIIDSWLRKVWTPSYNAVMAAQGTVEEAMINARIRNSSPASAKCAIEKAAGQTDRIKAELDAYIDSACGGNPRHKDRWGAMMRPVTLYRYFR